MGRGKGTVLVLLNYNFAVLLIDGCNRRHDTLFLYLVMSRLRAQCGLQISQQIRSTRCVHEWDVTSTAVLAVFTVDVHPTFNGSSEADESANPATLQIDIFSSLDSRCLGAGYFPPPRINTPRE